MGLRAVERQHLQGPAARHLGGDLVDFVLGDGEYHGDRLNLRDDAQARRAVGRHDVTRIDVAQSHASGDRRGDARVVDVHLRGGEIAFVELHRGFVRVHRRLLRRQLLLGDRMHLDGVLVANEIDACILEHRLITPELPLRLLERSDIRPRIDDGQEVVLFDDLAFLEVHIRDHSRDAAHDGIGVDRSNGADGVEIDVQGSDAGGREDDGDRGRGRTLRLGLVDRAHNDHEEDQHHERDEGLRDPVRSRGVVVWRKSGRVSRRLGGRLRLGHGQDVSGVRSIASSGTLERASLSSGP